jgi:hypothetical protein
MAFFEAPEPSRLEPDEPPEPKPWWAPPLRTLPGLVAETIVLAHTDRVAVAVSHVAAYPVGFSFALQTVPRRHGPRAWGDIDFMGWGHGVDASGRLPDDLLRFGVEFADGGRATSLDILARRERSEAPPAGPVLWHIGGGGGGGRWSHDVWVWPLPPPGRLTFACEWPALGIPLTRVDVDAGTVRAAAGRARVLWPDAGPEPGDRNVQDPRGGAA